LPEVDGVCERRSATDHATGGLDVRPAATSASSATMSSLLAAQCSGVSLWGPTNRAVTSAPAATSSAIVSATRGKCPGQSVALALVVKW